MNDCIDKTEYIEPVLEVINFFSQEVIFTSGENETDQEEIIH